MTERDIYPERQAGDNEVGVLLRTLAAEEQEIRREAIEQPAGTFGWIPYPIALFITYLSDAVQEAPGKPIKFLDVGCGPGTKMIIAEAMFDMQVAGLEIVHDWALRGRQRGLRVIETDARTWDGYDLPDVVYFNRPVADQEEFEQHVMDGMRPGAVMISVNGRLRPSQLGWLIVAEEIADPRAPVNGVWMKP